MQLAEKFRLPIVCLVALRLPRTRPRNAGKPRLSPSTAMSRLETPINPCH